MTKRTHQDDRGKTCTKCGLYQPYDKFYRLRTAKDGRQSWCKACTIAYSTAKNKRDGIIRAGLGRKRDRIQTDRARQGRTSAEQVHYTYNIPQVEAERLRSIPACQCCGRPISVEARTHSIDHDWDRGQVRGVLCLQCNTGIGKLGDTLEGVEQAAYYLVRNLDVLGMAQDVNN